jgi:molybdopterin synthase sulfur carrier subunit
LNRAATIRFVSGRGFSRAAKATNELAALAAEGNSMAITIQIPTALRRHTAGVGSIACAATNLGELFSVLDEKFPDLKPHLRDEAGQLRRFLNIYVNEEDIRFLGGPEYIFSDGDEVLLVPSIAGGSS